MNDRRINIILVATVLVVTLLVFWRVGGHQFIGYDDNLYVTENPVVQQGLTWEGMKWAFSNGHAGNWHPLTWLSHMLDWQLFGEDAGRHHMTSCMLHALNASLLFLVMLLMTSNRWPSFFVSLVFAIHPLHVESVAWISERKDLLSTTFWLLTMMAYTRYVMVPGRLVYVLTLVTFALGLMSKPMLVTLPFVLLLIDIWPLNRTLSWRLASEKIPFFVLAAASSVVTLIVQSAAGAVKPLEQIALTDRLANAVVSFVTYLLQTAWPSGLAIPYPYVSDLPAWKVLGSAVVLLAISVSAVLSLSKRPFAAVGWLWYLGTLVPVIGLVQIGIQARADRYTYIPMIGLLIAVSWGARSLVPTRSRAVLSVPATLIVIALSFLTVRQLGYWKDNETLFRRALAVTENNKVAHYNLALHLSRDGRDEEAIHHLEQAVRIKPDDYDARWNLANALLRTSRTGDAAVQLRWILTVTPDAVEPMTKLATILTVENEDIGEAIDLAEKAATLTSREEPMVLWVLARAYGAAGRIDEANATACDAYLQAKASGKQNLVAAIERRFHGSPCSR